MEKEKIWLGIDCYNEWDPKEYLINDYTLDEESKNALYNAMKDDASICDSEDEEENKELAVNYFMQEANYFVDDNIMIRNSKQRYNYFIVDGRVKYELEYKGYQFILEIEINDREYSCFNTEALELYNMLLRYRVYRCLELDNGGEIDYDEDEAYFTNKDEALEYAEDLAKYSYEAEAEDEYYGHGINTIVIMRSDDDWKKENKAYDYFKIYYCGDKFEEEY